MVERPLDPLASGMVRIRFGAGGICGSDMHYYRHARTGDFVVTSPLVLGHEIAHVALLSRRKPIEPRQREEELTDTVAARLLELEKAAAEREARQTAALAVEHPATNRGWGVRLSPLHADLVGDTARVLWILFALIGSYVGERIQVGPTAGTAD